MPFVREQCGHSKLQVTFPAASMRLPEPVRRAGCHGRVTLSLVLHFLGGMGLARATGLSPASSLGEFSPPGADAGEGDFLLRPRGKGIYTVVACQNGKEVLSWKKATGRPRDKLEWREAEWGPGLEVETLRVASTPVLGMSGRHRLCGPPTPQTL